MGIKVAKFGGSSVADMFQMNKIKRIIEDDAERKYVVVSAPGKRFEGDSKITDLLYLCYTHIVNNLPYEQVLQIVIDRYLSSQRNLGVKIDLAPEFEIIKKKLTDGAGEDYIASRGEYLNAIMIADFLGYDFVDAAGLIVFDERGRFLADETDRLLGEELKKHDKAVIPGFYGTMPDGTIKTFSRGGSDITGSLVARAVRADVYENWTDVSGFLIADPRIVDDPKPIDTVTYTELRELSYMGASVLHEDAIYPVKEAGIPINIRNTNVPEDRGTMITAKDEGHQDRIITGIAGSKDFTVIGIHKNQMAGELGFIRKLTTILDEHHLSIEHIPSGIDTICVVVSNDQLKGMQDEVVKEIWDRLKPDAVDVFDNMAMIATVGCHMSRRPGVAAKLFTALAGADVNIRMIDQGSSEMNIIVGVENKDFETAIRAIYNAFMTKGVRK